MLMMRNVSKDLLLLNSIADCDGKRKSHFKSLKEHTDDYSCSVEIVKFTVYEDFCQLITVHLSLNGVDPLSELQRFVAMNPSEIGVKMGHTLSEYAFAFPNFIQHMHDSNPELDYSKQLELIAKKLQLFPLNSLIERMNTTIDNRIERMSKIVFITVLEFYKNSLEESTALDKIVEQCRQDLVDGSSDLFSSMHASFLKEKKILYIAIFHRPINSCW